MYLFRAVDRYGQTVEFYVSETRDRDAAKLYLRKDADHPDNGPPYGLPETGCAAIRPLFTGSKRKPESARRAGIARGLLQ